MSKNDRDSGGGFIVLALFIAAIWGAISGVISSFVTPSGVGFTEIINMEMGITLAPFLVVAGFGIVCGIFNAVKRRKNAIPTPPPYGGTI